MSVTAGQKGLYWWGRCGFQASNPKLAAYPQQSHCDLIKQDLKMKNQESRREMNSNRIESSGFLQAKSRARRRARTDWQKRRQLWGGRSRDRHTFPGWHPARIPCRARAVPSQSTVCTHLSSCLQGPDHEHQHISRCPHSSLYRHREGLPAHEAHPWT